MKLRANQRPQFVPPAGISPAELTSLWGELEEAEKQRDAALRAELVRQLKLSSMYALFQHKYNLLNEWGTAKQRILESMEGEVFESVNQVQMRLKIVAAFDTEYEASMPRVAELKELGKALLDDNFENSSSVQTCLTSIDEMWAKLQEV